MKLIKFVLLAVSLFSIDTTSAVVIRRTTKKITRTKSIEIPTIGKPIATCIQCVDCVDCEANPQMAINCPHTCMKKPIKPIEPIRPIDPIEPPTEPIYCIQCVGCVDCEKNPQMAINCPGTCKQNYLKEI